MKKYIISVLLTATTCQLAIAYYDPFAERGGDCCDPEKIVKIARDLKFVEDRMRNSHEKQLEKQYENENNDIFSEEIKALHKHIFKNNEYNTSVKNHEYIALKIITQCPMETMGKSLIAFANESNIDLFGENILKTNLKLAELALLRMIKEECIDKDLLIELKNRVPKTYDHPLTDEKVLKLLNITSDNVLAAKRDFFKKFKDFSHSIDKEILEREMLKSSLSSTNSEKIDKEINTEISNS
jgi:hypothetical protein